MCDENSPCPICHTSNNSRILIQKIYSIDCHVCGKFKVTTEYCEDNSSCNNELSASLRYWHEKGFEKLVENNNYQDIIISVPFPKTPLEKIDLILDYINRHTNNYAIGARVFEENDYTIAFTKNKEEFEFFFKQSKRT